MFCTFFKNITFISYSLRRHVWCNVIVIENEFAMPCSNPECEAVFYSLHAYALKKGMNPSL